MSYRLLMLSGIPVHWDGQQYRTMDLWAVDLTGQVRQTTSFTLICTVVDQVPPGWTSTAAVPPGINVVDAETLDPPRALLGHVQTRGHSRARHHERRG